MFRYSGQFLGFMVEVIYWVCWCFTFFMGGPVCLGVHIFWIVVAGNSNIRRGGCLGGVGIWFFMGLGYVEYCCWGWWLGLCVTW